MIPRLSNRNVITEPQLTRASFIHNQADWLWSKLRTPASAWPGTESPVTEQSLPALINTDRWSTRVEELTGLASDCCRFRATFSTTGMKQEQDDTRWGLKDADGPPNQFQGKHDVQAWRRRRGKNPLKFQVDKSSKGGRQISSSCLSNTFLLMRSEASSVTGQPRTVREMKIRKSEPEPEQTWLQCC